MAQEQKSFGDYLLMHSMSIIGRERGEPVFARYVSWAQNLTVPAEFMPAFSKILDQISRQDPTYDPDLVFREAAIVLFGTLFSDPDDAIYAGEYAQSIATIKIWQSEVVSGSGKTEVIRKKLEHYTQELGGRVHTRMIQ